MTSGEMQAQAHAERVKLASLLGLEFSDYRGRDRLIRLAIAEVERLRAEIARRNSYDGCDGCSTGDCPHGSVSSFIIAQAEMIREQAAEIERLRGDHKRLRQERDAARRLANGLVGYPIKWDEIDAPPSKWELTDAPPPTTEPRTPPTQEKGE